MSKFGTVVILRQRKNNNHRMYAVRRFSREMSVKELENIRKKGVSKYRHKWKYLDTEAQAWFESVDLMKGDDDGHDNTVYLKKDVDFVGSITPYAQQIKELVEGFDESQKLWLFHLDESMKSAFRGFTIFTVLNILHNSNHDISHPNHLFRSNFCDRIGLKGKTGELNREGIKGLYPMSIMAMYKRGWTTDEVLKFMLTYPKAVFKS